MDRLRRPFEELGLEDVSTFIASGNVIFRSDAKAVDLEPDLEAALHAALGFEVPTFVRPASTVGRLADQEFDAEIDPFVEVGFLKQAPTARARSALESLGNDTDRVTASGREIFWIARHGIGGSTISGHVVEKTLGQQTTFRNLKMLRRLHVKLNP